MHIEGEKKTLEIEIDGAKIGQILQNLIEMDGVKLIQDQDSDFAIDSLDSLEEDS